MTRCHYCGRPASLDAPCPEHGADWLDRTVTMLTADELAEYACPSPPEYPRLRWGTTRRGGAQEQWEVW